MRIGVIGIVTITLSMATARPASAEWQIKPFFGVTYGGSTTFSDPDHAVGEEANRCDHDVDPYRTTAWVRVGRSIAWLITPARYGRGVGHGKIVGGPTAALASPSG